MVTVNRIEGYPTSYSYEITGPDDYSEKVNNKQENTHTFDKLKIDKEYTIKVIVKNKVGLTKEITKSVKTSKTESSIDIELSPKDEYIKEGTVTIIYDIKEEGLVGKYKWNEEEFTTANQNTIEIPAKNGTLTAVLMDGEEIVLSKSLAINNIDDIEPVLTLSSVQNATNSITIPYSIEEEHIKDVTCKYGETNGDYKTLATISNNSCILNSIDNTKTYYYEICVTDKAGNKVCKNSNTKSLIINKTNNQIEYVYIGENTSTEIEKGTAKIISCNNSVTINDEGQKLKIENISKTSKCNFSNDIQEIVKGIDNTENNMLLLTDVTESKTITISENETINIDLNGKNMITTYGIQNNGTLSLTNSKKSSGEMSSTGIGINTTKNSVTNISDLRLISTNTELASAICNSGYLHISGDTYIEGLYGIGCHADNNAKTIIENVTIKATEFDALMVNPPYTATVIIKNGKFTSEKRYAINNNTGTIKINGGTFDSQEGFANYQNGTINICNATITSKSNIDLKNITTGTINYSSRVIFTNKTNTPQISNLGTGKILGNYSGTCLE